MITHQFAQYRCPATRAAMQWSSRESDSSDMPSGRLTTPTGRGFSVKAGVPDFVYPDRLSEVESQTQREYDQVAERIYDAALDWQFQALYEDEEAVRELMIDMCQLKPNARVLEIGCGTGRDSFRLARRLGEHGALYMQDLSPNMVYTCRDRMRQYDQQMNFSCDLQYFVSNGAYLPFDDGFFDVVFHFGGFNQFGDLPRAAEEFARVTKLGGRVLYGDESVGPWLRGTEFEGIVGTNNPLFRSPLPLETIPVCARDVTVRWIMGNCFYVIAFTKGDGPPPLNLDLMHAGRRGGSMRTRYFGQLEGVSLETKELAQQAAQAAGMSMHQWLDTLVRVEAERVLEGPVATREGGHE
ncbi:MAG: class I SAM-dependent methyltransferase [Pirellulaceae bacterium]